MLPSSWSITSKQLGGWIYFNAFESTTANNFDPTRGSIYPYVKSRGVYVCPSDSNGALTGNSYAFNACTGTVGTTLVAFHQGLSDAAFSSPSSTILLGEEAEWNGSTDDGSSIYNAVSKSGDSPTNRHTGGGNYTFVDGHVKFVRPDTLVSQNYFIGGDAANVCSAQM